MTKPTSQWRGEKCIWRTCYDLASLRYDIPICDAHAEAIADRVDHINQTKRNLAKSSRAQAEAEHLKMKVHALQSIIERQKIYLQQARSQGPRETPTDGTIYYLRVGSYIKIGWTSKLDDRMRSYPPDSLLLATHPGTRDDEARLHKRFAVHRSHGREWYPLVPQLLEHIDRMTREHGEPEQATFGAQPVEVPQPRPKAYIRPRGWRGVYPK